MGCIVVVVVVFFVCAKTSRGATIIVIERGTIAADCTGFTKVAGVDCLDAW